MQQSLIVAQDSAFSRRQVAAQFQRDVVGFDEQLEAAFKAHEKAVKANHAAQAAAIKESAALAQLVAEVAPEAGSALARYVEEVQSSYESMIGAALALPKLTGVHDGALAAARRSVKAYERACKEADDSNKDKEKEKDKEKDKDNTANDGGEGAAAEEKVATTSDLNSSAGTHIVSTGSAGIVHSADENFAQARLDVVMDLALANTVRHCDVPDAIAAVLNAHVQFARKLSQLSAPLETLAHQIQVAGRARREQAAVDHAALLSAQLNGWPGISAASAAASATGLPVHHAGFLFVKQTTGVLRDWQRRYFVLHDDRLDFFRLSKDFLVIGSAPVLLLRATPRPSDARSFVFELATPNEQWIVAASSQLEQAAWIEALAARTAHLLESQSRGADDGGVAAEKRAALLAELRAVPGNNKCADCGAADPTWTSLNHGALVCVQCSGVHRSLSTAVSKVFSLTLDDLSPAATALLRAIGNDAANGVLERSVPAEARVATSDAAAGANVGGTRGTADERLGRERFARAKYSSGSFVGTDGVPEAAFVCAAIDAGDLAALLRAVVAARTDATLSKVMRGEEPASDKERSLLHRAVAVGNTVAVELLLLNGAQTDQAGADGMKPIHVAISRGDTPIAEALLDHRCEVDELAVSMAEATLPAILPALRESLQRKEAHLLAAAERERQHAEHLAALAADAEKLAAAAAGGTAGQAAEGESWSATAWSKIKSRRNAPAGTAATTPGTPPRADAPATVTTTATTATTTTTTAVTTSPTSATTTVNDDKPEKKDSRFASFKAGLAKKAAAVKEQAANFRNRNTAAPATSERPADDTSAAAPAPASTAEATPSSTTEETEEKNE
jgi:hypothetical protein